MPPSPARLSLALRLAGSLFLLLAAVVFVLTATGVIFDELLPQKNYAVVLLFLAFAVIIEAGRYAAGREWATATGGYRALLLVALALNTIIGAVGAAIAALVLLDIADVVPALALLALFVPIVLNVIVALVRSSRPVPRAG